MGLSIFSGQYANKEFWAQDKLDSEQRMLKVRTKEGYLPAMSAQRKGRAKLNQKPKVNKFVARVIAKKYTKQRLFKKPKAKKAHQTEQARSEAEVGGAYTASPKKAEQ